ncbi:MAG: AsmA family protein [Pseudomonadota bacterium]
MKRFFAVLLLLCVLAVAALLVAPSFIDWNAYRGELAALLSRTAGRQVSIDGDLEMAILPSPHLNVREVRIANLEGASEANLARVGEIRMRIAPGPLFSGRITVSSLLLVEPVISLETMPDGRTNWDIAANGGQPAPGGQGEPADKSALPLQISFERVAIADGTLAWQGANGRTQKLERLNTQIAMTDLVGPLKLEASANYRDLPFAISLDLGRRDTGKPIPVSARIVLADGVGEISLSGAADSQSQTVEGEVGISGPDAAAFATALAGKPVAGLPAWEFTLESPISATPEALEAGQISVRLGKLDAAGQALLGLGETPALKASLDVASVDIDEMLAQARQADESAPDREDGGGEPRDPAAIPEGFDAEVDIKAGILRWRRGIVRDAGLTVKLEAGVLTVERLSAQLPGGTAVNLSGKAVNADGGPRLDGDLAVISDNLRAALVWSGVDEASLPPDRLRAFSYTSRIAILPDTVNLTDVKARFDATRVSGAAAIARRERPSFGVSLELDRIGLDAYLAGRGDGKRETPATGQAADRSAGGLGAFDANFDLSVGSLTWRDKTASAVRVDAQLFNGDLAVRKLTAGDLGGAALAMSGSVTGLAGEPRAILDVTLDGRDPEAFAGFIGMKSSALAQRVGRFKISGRATGTLDRAEIDAVLDAVGGKVRAKGAVTGLDGRVASDLAISVSHADGDPVLALAMPGRRAGGAGPLEARFRMSGGADALAFRDISGKLGETDFSGTIDVAMSGERPDIVADLATGVVSLDRLFPAKSAPATGAGAPPVRGNARWSREPIDATGLRDFDLRLALRSESLVRRNIRVDGANLRATVENGVATIEDFSGQLFGGGIKATGRLDATTAAPSMEGVVAARDVSSRAALAAITEFARFEGPVSLDLALKATGRNEFELISSLAGNGAVTGDVEARLKDDERTQAGVGALLGAILGNKVRELGATGDALGTLIRAFAVEPSALSGDFVIRKGVARTDNLLLDGKDARALTVGSADLANWLIDSNTDMRRGEDKDEPYITLGLKGPLDAPNIRSGGSWLKRPPEPAPPQPIAPQQPAASPEPAPKKPPRPEDLILDILKQPTEPAPEQPPATPEPAPEKKPKPEDFILDILKSIQ